MEKLTKRLNDGGPYFITETKIQHGTDGYSGEAADKLAFLALLHTHGL